MIHSLASLWTIPVACGFSIFSTSSDFVFLSVSSHPHVLKSIAGVVDLFQKVHSDYAESVNETVFGLINAVAFIHEHLECWVCFLQKY